MGMTVVGCTKSKLVDMIADAKYAENCRARAEQAAQWQDRFFATLKKIKPACTDGVIESKVDLKALLDEHVNRTKPQTEDGDSPEDENAVGDGGAGAANADAEYVMLSGMAGGLAIRSP
eukprot:8004798-Pyramimonas_sp.AAC.1